MLADMGLLAVRQNSPPLPVRRWDPELDHSSNSWSSTSVSLSSSPGHASLPIGCSPSRSRMDLQQLQASAAGLSPPLLQTSSTSQAAFTSGTATSTGLQPSSLSSSSSAGISKKVHVSHYMDRSSSSPRLTLKFHHIKQKDSSNKHTMKNVSENSKPAGYSSYRVSLGTTERPATECARPLISPSESSEKHKNPSSDQNGTSPLSGAVLAEAKALWNGGSSMGLRGDAAGNVDQMKSSDNVVTKSLTDTGSDLSDKSKSFSNQFEDISDAEDDRPSKPLDMGSAAKIFSLSQLSHIPSVSAVYQCHPNSGALFYDGGGTAPISSLPLLSGLSWSNIGYGNYGGVSGSVGGPAGTQFPLPISTDKSQTRQATTDGSVFPWGQGNVPVKSIPSMKAMVPLSIDTDVAQSQVYGCTEKPDSKVSSSDLLISLPPSSLGSSGSTLRPSEPAAESHASGDLKFFIKKETPSDGSQRSEHAQSYLAFPGVYPEKLDTEKKPRVSPCEPLAIEMKTSPSGNSSEGHKRENIADIKPAVLDPSVECVETNTTTKSEETVSRRLDEQSRMVDREPVEKAVASSEVEDSIMSTDDVLDDGKSGGFKVSTDNRVGGVRSGSDLSRIPASVGSAELLESQHLESTGSVLRVPPLKIIIPSKNGAIIDKDVLTAKMVPSKLNLPYIVNVTQNSTVEQSCGTTVDSLPGKEGGTSPPEAATADCSVGTENSQTDPKDWSQTRKRKFKTSCKV